MSENTDEKLDFIVNLLFDIYCHVDVHHNELLGSMLAKAESLGFDVTPSKTWDYDKTDYEYMKKYGDEGLYDDE